jgi:hypothetical protein
MPRHDVVSSTVRSWNRSSGFFLGVCGVLAVISALLI